jgi:hypothetical protein
MAMTCSTITLASAIHVMQDTLHIHGPGANQLTIDGDHAGRVFYHTGGGTLGISDVTITNGKYVDVGAGTHHGGGCIFSSKNVLLIRSVVSHCLLDAAGAADTSGAGIYTSGYLSLFDSSVLDNYGLTTAANSWVHGGGA